MLFRAFVYSCYPTPASEACVFFEAPCATDAPLRLVQLVSTVWGCALEAVQFYNLASEGEMRLSAEARCFERGAEADSLLLETGWDGHDVLHTLPSRTMLLVSPRWHARLAAAQQLVDQHRLLRRFHDLADRTLAVPVPAHTPAAAAQVHA